MRELIDRAALIAEYDRVHVGPPGGARKLIEDAPTIEERKTGRWMVSYLDHEVMGVRPKLLYCSECCQCIAYLTNFCPNCGADMREGQE